MQDLQNHRIGRIEIDDPDTSGHYPDPQSGFMQENYTVRTLWKGIWIIFDVVIRIQESDILSVWNKLYYNYTILAGTQLLSKQASFDLFLQEQVYHNIMQYTDYSI